MGEPEGGLFDRAVGAGQPAVVLGSVGSTMITSRVRGLWTLSTRFSSMSLSHIPGLCVGVLHEAR